MADLDMEEMLDGDMVDSSELLRLKEKVRALEKQNALLKQTTKNGETVDGATAAAVGDEKIEDIKLLDIEELNDSDENWLLNMNEEEGDGNDDWLRQEIMSPNTLKKKSLVSKLDDIAKRSPVHSGYSSPLNGSYRVNSSYTSSPYKSLATSPPSAKYVGAGPVPVRGQGNFDPRTFTRGSTARQLGAYSLPPGDEATPPRKSSYHRLNFGSAAAEDTGLNATFDKEEESGNSTFTTIGDKLNGTFNKASNEVLNSTFDKVDDKLRGRLGQLSSDVTDNRGLNSTFDRNSPSKRHNSTFDRPQTEVLNSTFTNHYQPTGGGNSTFTQNGDSPSSAAVMNATFEKECGNVNGGSANHRKMSEDRLSSASSSCDVSNRLSRESSQDLLVEDMDRLSTTSAMSESSVSHRLNDVQDVQDIARMQEESLKHSTPLKNQRSETISPLSEHSLSSPVEDGGGYQSEESCGSESGNLRQGPRRGDNHPRLQVYSSQDSLPDSPYSSQSLDSHASQGMEVRRSMPNLNKLRGGKVGVGRGGLAPSSGTQYGLSQSKYTNSESRLQPPTRMAAPVRAAGLRAPTATGLARPSGLRPPGGERKLSGIARPQGLPRPTSKLQPPGSYRSGLPMRGAPGAGRVSSSQGGRVGDNKNWIEDCY